MKLSKKEWRNLMKKKAILLVLTLTMVLLAGCGKKGEVSKNSEEAAKTETPAPEASEEVKVLDVFWFADGSETQAMEKLITEYEGLNPGIKVNLLEVPYAEMENKIMMSVSGGEAPALSRTTESILSAVYEATVDLGDYVDDKEEFVGQFLPSIENYYVINGKICAAPTDVTANGMIYNKTAFEKAGVKVPSSPEDIA